MLNVVLWLLLLAPANAAQRHVRIVLDVSGSMRRWDPDRLALLSSTLLLDLMNLKEREDTFEVIPFDNRASWRWDPSGPPLTTNGTPINALNASGTFVRSDFVTQLSSINYNGRWTSYHPGIKAALDSINAAKAAAPPATDTTSVVVLITDGLPEGGEAEKEMIVRDLQPQLRAADIDFHVLTVGQLASEQIPNFFAPLVAEGSGNPLGLALSAPDGTQLPLNMSLLFAWSFGYTSHKPRPLGRNRYQADIAGPDSPDHVYLIGLRNGSAPRIETTAPGGGVPTVLRQEDDLAGAGASYQFQQINRPVSGNYTIDSDAGQLAILRPSVWQLVFTDAPSAVIAGHETDFTVCLRTRGGGAPSDGDVNFRAHEGEILPLDDDPNGGKWQGSLSKRGGNVRPGTVATTTHCLMSTFSATFTPYGQEVYPAMVESMAVRKVSSGMSTTPNIMQRSNHFLQVHPHLKIAQRSAANTPQGTVAGGDELRAGAKGSLSVVWKQHDQKGSPVSSPVLPGPGPRYPIRARLKPPMVSGAVLSGADALDALGPDTRILLDGMPVQFPYTESITDIDAAPADDWAWFYGRTLQSDDLIGEHQITVEMGTPTRSGRFDIPLEVRWNEQPYDQPDIVEEFTVVIQVRQAGWWAQNGMLLLLLLLLLLLAALLRYGRDRPRLPPDLRFSAGLQQGSMEPRALGPAPVVRRLLALIDRHAVYHDGMLLGELEPVGADLYRLRSGQISNITTVGDDSTPKADGPHWLLHAGRTYRIQKDGSAYFIRLEYAR